MAAQAADMLPGIGCLWRQGYFHGYDPLRFPEVFESITPEDVTAFLKTNVTAERMVLSRIVPKQ